MKTILVTGASGYIGSHIATLFARSGFLVIGLDVVINKALLAHPNIMLVQGNCCDAKLVAELFKKYAFHAVMHCASLIEVGTSVVHPESYYQNNLQSTLTILHAMRTHETPFLVFASSCAVYGSPSYIPLDEQHPKDPISPYGRTKLAVEWMLSDFSAAYNLRTVALRFFNAAGSWHDLGLGESHMPETHLLPKLICAAREKRPVEIFGTDYPTPDGTCVRDFVSVGDIARAHVAALSYLEHGGTSTEINLGSERGTSVLTIIKELELLLHTSITVHHRPRRPGDPAILVADASKAFHLLTWKPTDSLRSILHQAASWHLRKSVANQISA